MKHLFLALFLTMSVSISAHNSIAFNDVSEKNGSIITKEIASSTVDVPVDNFQAPTRLVHKRPQSGSVKKRLRSISFGTTEWTLSNDVVVVFRPTDYKDNEIIFEASSLGGYSKVSLGDLPSAYALNEIMKTNGRSDLSYANLQQILGGKTAKVEASLDEQTENLSGRSSIQDFETMLQLIYLNFQKPHEDAAAFDTSMQRLRNEASSRASNQQKVFADSLLMKWTSYDKRTTLLNEEMLNNVNYNKVLDIFNKRFSSANDFVFVFTGNIDPEDAATEKLICTWLGSLPKGKGEEYSKQANDHPKGPYTSRFVTNVGMDISTNTIRYYAPMEYSWTNLINMHIIEYIAKYRIMEKAKGASPLEVKTWISKYPTEEGVLSIQFNCNPKAREAVVRLVKEEVQRLVKEGASSEDFIKAKESMFDQFDKDVQDNGYWASSLVRYYMYGRDYINEYRDWIDYITLESIRETLDKLVASENVFEVSMQKER